MRNIFENHDVWRVNYTADFYKCEFVTLQPGLEEGKIPSTQSNTNDLYFQFVLVLYILNISYLYNIYLTVYVLSTLVDNSYPAYSGWQLISSQ